MRVDRGLYLRVDAEPWSTAACDSRYADFDRKHAYRCICGSVNETDGYLPEDEPYACTDCGVRVYPRLHKVVECLTDDSESEGE